MPPDLHAQLAAAAERAGTSLNQFINDALTRALDRSPAREEPAGDRPARSGSRLVPIALVANVVVVGVAAAAAIVLIVLALTG